MVIVVTKKKNCLLLFGVILLVVFSIILNCYGTLKTEHYSIKVINKNHKIKIKKEQAEELVVLIENILEDKQVVIRELYLFLPLDDIKEFQKSGLSIIVTYIDSKELSIGADKIKVKEIDILADDKNSYIIVYSETGSNIFYLNNNYINLIISFCQ